jgi:hypothetical protein
MTENGLDIPTISTKRTDFQAERVLLLGQVTEKQESHPFAFFKISFTSRTNGTFGFARDKSPCFEKPKDPFLSNVTKLRRS